MLIIFHDEFVFVIFQTFLVLIAAYGFVRDNSNRFRNGQCVATIKRGEQSWKDFNLVYGILALIVLQVINTSEAFKGYKTFITLLDLGLLLYLCFYNGWFRNKVLGLLVKSREMEER